MRQSDDYAHLQAIVENALDVIIRINEKGIIEWVNSASKRIFGYTQNELVGKNVSVLVPDPDGIKHDSYISRYIKTKDKRVIGKGKDVLCRKKDGTTFPVHLSIIEIKCGSLRTGSYTRMALNVALMGAKDAGAKINLIDLRNFDLPLMDGRSDEETFPEDVFKLRDEVKKSDGIILGTPEYHGGYSGVLKNALDLMGFDEFQGKMIGLLGVSGGSMGATNSLNGLHVIGRSLRAWVVPLQVSIASAYDEFDKEGNLKNRVLEQRVKKLGEEVTRFAYLHKIGNSEEFLEAWQGALINPGGERKSKE